MVLDKTKFLSNPCMLSSLLQFFLFPHFSLFLLSFQSFFSFNFNHLVTANRWSRASFRRKVLCDFAESKGLNPLSTSTWYTVVAHGLLLSNVSNFFIICCSFQLFLFSQLIIKILIGREFGIGCIQRKSNCCTVGSVFRYWS